MSTTAKQLLLDIEHVVARTEIRIERLRSHIAHRQRKGREGEGVQRVLDRAERQLKRLLLYRSTLVTFPGLLAYIQPEVLDALRLALT
jgi:hypothetical protein